MRYLITISILLLANSAYAEDKVETNFNMTMTTNSGKVYSFNDHLNQEQEVRLPGAIQAKGWVCNRGATVLNNAGDKYYTAFTCSNDDSKTIIGAAAVCSSSEKSSDTSKFDIIVYSNNSRISVTFTASCQTEMGNHYGI